IAALGEPRVCVRRKLDGDVPVGKLCFKLEHELLDNLRDNPLRQMTKGDHRIKPVAELRREEPLDGILIIPDALLLREADCRLCHIGSARICRHDKYDIAEVDLLAVMVGQLAVIHDLQKNVEEVRMRLFDRSEERRVGKAGGWRGSASA